MRGSTKAQKSMKTNNAHARMAVLFAALTLTVADSGIAATRGYSTPSGSRVGTIRPGTSSPAANSRRLTTPPKSPSIDWARIPKDTPVKWYDTGHELNDPQALTDRATWLREKLGVGKLP